MSIAIWAPHPDDEIIGCHSVLIRKGEEPTVYFGTVDSGCQRSADMFGFSFELLDVDRVGREWDVVYAPDPRFDLHPYHQKWGFLSQMMFRSGYIKRLIHYTTTMQAPYICEVPNPTEKRDALDSCYPEKSDLWRYEHKYFLFEGYNEWHRLNHV